MEKNNVKHEFSAGSLPSKGLAESSGFLDSQSDISSYEGGTSFEKGFFWKSRYQHAVYFIAYTVSWGMFTSNRKGRGTEDSDNIPTWFHMFLTYIIFAGPLLYLQVFIGQYTQKGCIVLGAMLPLAYGIGYCMLLNTLLSCSLNFYFSAAVLYYALISMINYPTPSWMICLYGYSQSTKRCFSRDDIDLCFNCRHPNHKENPPCYDPANDIFSAQLFQENIIFGSEIIEGAVVSPRIVQGVNLFITTAIVLILTVRTLKDLYDSIHFFMILGSVAIIIALAVILLNHPSLDLIISMFYFNPTSVFKIECWTQAFSSTAFKVNIVEGGHLLFGSYMPLTVNCTRRVTYIIILHLVFFFLSSALGFLMEDYLACSLNIDKAILSRFSDFQTSFTIYPTALGILAAAQLWATIYFLVLFIMMLYTIVLQIIIMQETLSQEIIGPTYWIYTRVLLVIVVSVAALIYALIGTSTFVYELYLHRNLIQFFIVCIIYIILFLYGIDRFSDDIHFILHSPPSIYLKWSWGLGGILCFSILVIYFLQESYLQSPEIATVISLIIFLPLPIGFFFKLFLAVKARELSALIKPSRTFGPADSEERANRRLFNPRFEVRFRRKRNFCKHRCLLGSVTLRKCLEKELTLLNHAFVELSEKEEDERVINKEFVEVLRKHKEIMMNALNFDPTKEYFRSGINYNKLK